eukprot:scaffold12202_cov32-Tisochrysis_lutea.AAC.4
MGERRELAEAVDGQDVKSGGQAGPSLFRRKMRLNTMTSRKLIPKGEACWPFPSCGRRPQQRAEVGGIPMSEVRGAAGGTHVTLEKSARRPGGLARITYSSVQGIHTEEDATAGRLAESEQSKPA